MSELFVASVTPFLAPNGGVDHAWIPHHLRWLEANGVDGVVPCGTTGEGPSLSFAERQAVIDTVLAHRGNLKVIPGTGCVALPETIVLTNYALEHGADAAMVLPPFYFKSLSDAGLLAFYRTVCDALPENGKIVLYHIPPVSQIPIPTSVIDGLLESHANAIFGIKDSGGDVEHTAMLAKRYPSLKIYAGGASLFARALAGGAAGGIFAIANVFPQELRAIITAHTAGQDTTDAQGRVAALETAVKTYTAIPAIKALLRLADLPIPSSRLPLVDLTEQEAQSVWERIGK